MAKRKSKKRSNKFKIKLVCAVLVFLIGCLYGLYHYPSPVRPYVRATVDSVGDKIHAFQNGGRPADVPVASDATPSQSQAIITVKSNYPHLALGVPGKADTIVDRPGYALGYIEEHEQPAWVIYRLTKQQALTKVAKRDDNFREDPSITTGSATLADYRRSGYDRGHLAPAADMAYSTQTMEDSFFMSNMSPQRPAFNRGIWKDLEAQVRDFAITEGDVYIVTGPILPKSKTTTIGNNKVTVPEYYYKVIYDRTLPEKMIGFILPNDGSNRPLQDFAVTVDAVESATGLNFFSLVPQPKQEQLESTISVRAWNWDQRK